MDRHFLEFMGTFLIEAAKGQKQLEDMTRWIGGDLSGFDNLTRMLRQFYGMDRQPPASPDDAKAWEKASQNFKQSYREWLRLISVVPISEYQILEKKCAALEEKVAAQNKTIGHLRNLLSEKGIPSGDTVQGFIDLMEEQGRQFQELMENMGKAFKKD